MRGATNASRRRILTVVVGIAVVVIVAVIVVVGLRPPTPTTALGAPRFVDETAAAGIDQTYEGPFPYSVGAGVAVFDCDGDGRPDVHLAGGIRPAVVYRNESPVGGALSFTPVPGSGADLEGVTGAYPLDIDGDGLVDLAVLRDGENVLLRGLGACRFERANQRWSFDGGDRFTTAFSATWEPGETLPTLAVGNYLFDVENLDPDHLCADNQLVRPADATGYAPPTSLTPGWCVLSMLFSDWDRSGRRDLRVSNDREYYSDLSDGQEQLWRIAPGEPPRLYTDLDGWALYRIQGMGIASHDLTGDGYPEFYLTSQGPNVLQTLLAGPSTPTYRDISLKRGVAATRPFTGGDPLPSTAWHPEFQDVNNDGFVDLFVTKGNVDTQADYASRDPNELFIGQPDGTFVQGADVAGIVRFERGRGAALVDFNLDGLLDLVVSNFRDPVRVWRGVGAGEGATAVQMGHWVQLRLIDTGSNRDAIGSWIEVQVGETVLRREVVVGGGHIGGQLGWIHFGLGSADRARVRVQWPDGEVGPWNDVQADRFVEIRRGPDAPSVWQPPADWL